VRIQYDPQVSAAYVELGSPRSVVRTADLDGRVLIDYNADGKVAGIEILNVTDEPQVMHYPRMPEISIQPDDRYL